MSGQIPSRYFDDTIVPLPLERALVTDHYPLYLVHSISGNSLGEFRYLADMLWPHMTLCCFQVPRAQRTADTGSSLLKLAVKYVDELIAYHREHFGDMPFYIGGWSAGAIIALEMAQQLTKLGHPPLLLIAIDKAPRHTRAEIGPWNSTLRNVLLWFKRSWRNSDTWGQVLTSLGCKFWLVIRHGQLYGGPDSEYSSKQVIDDLTKRARSANERAFIRALYNQTTAYIPSSYPGRVLVLVTKDGYRDRVIEGWREIADDRRVVRILGDHNSVILGRRIQGRHQRDLADVQLLADELRYAMNELRLGLATSINR